MAAFAVYRNPNPDTAEAVPLLLEVQSDLLAVLHTAVVVPLYPKAAALAVPFSRLTPEVEVEGHAYLAMVPELAGVPRRGLQVPVADLSAHRGAVLAALDLLITGF